MKQYLLLFLFSFSFLVLTISASGTDCATVLMDEQCPAIEKKASITTRANGTFDIGFYKWTIEKSKLLEIEYLSQDDLNSAFKNNPTFKDIDKKSRAMSADPLRKKRLQELTSFAKTTLAAKLQSFESGLGRTEALSRLNSLKVVDLNSPDASKILDSDELAAFKNTCMTDGFEAFNYKAKNVLFLCPWMNLLSDEELVATLGHEMSHAFDPCVLSRNECQMAIDNTAAAVVPITSCARVPEFKSQRNPKSCTGKNSLNRKENLPPYAKTMQCLDKTYLTKDLQQCKGVGSDPTANGVRCGTPEAEHFAELAGKFVVDAATESGLLKSASTERSIESLLGLACVERKNKLSPSPLYPSLQNRLNIYLNTSSERAKLNCTVAKTSCLELEPKDRPTQSAPQNSTR